MGKRLRNFLRGANRDSTAVLFKPPVVSATTVVHNPTPRTMMLRFLLVAAVAVPACRPVSVSTAQQRPPSVQITFVAQSDSFAPAAREYEQIWAAEGARIVAAMERVSGLRFVNPDYADTSITANVREVASNSGYRASPMTLRASYPTDTKKATLVHELGHRMQSHLFRQSEEEHPQLFLWIYDVWVDLYGQSFADAQVAIERTRAERYVKAWDEALSYKTREARAARWKAIVAERTGPGW